MAWPSSRAEEAFSAHVLPGAWRCSGRNNEEMVDKFVHTGIITSKEVEDAFRAVPRGAFVPPELYDEAYYDQPLRGDPHVHMSAPHMYATVLEALDLCPGLSFLNIGSGTGYFSSLTGYIIKRHSINHGIDIHDDLVEFAHERRDEFLRFSPHLIREISPPIFLSGNCFRLDPSDRKYDRIYCGAACPPSKVAFILSMTKIGGFAIIPCKNKLLKIERISPTRVKQSVISEVCFASLTPLPERESSLAKIRFPADDKKTKEKSLHVKPADDLLVSRGPARTTLARLRALQEACESFKTLQPLPLPFCYVPCALQLQELRASKKKSPSPRPSKSGIASAVDSHIPFFVTGKGSGSTCEVDSFGNEDIWDHLQSDTLWEKVLEYYYSVCSVSTEQKTRTLEVYVKKKVDDSQNVPETKHPISYAELLHKLELSCAPLQNSNRTQALPQGGREDEGSEIKEGSDSKSDDLSEVNHFETNGNLTSSEIIKPGASHQQTQEEFVSAKPTSLEQDDLTSLENTITANVGSHNSNNSALNTPSDGDDSNDSNPQPSSGSELGNDIMDSTVQYPLHADKASEDPPCAGVSSENGHPKRSESSSSTASKEDSTIPNETTNNGPNTSTEGKTCSNKPSKVYKDVQLSVDQRHIDKLRYLPKRKWALDDDLELIRFLTDITEKSSKGRCKGWFKSELVRPELFSRMDTVAYPRIGSQSPDSLAFRAVALCRVGKVLDSTLYLLSGPSLLKELGTSYYKYGLESFTETSLMSSRNFLELCVGAMPVVSPKKDIGEVEPRGDPQEVLDTLDSKVIEQVRCQHELTSKKLKLTQGLQDQYKEQHKLLKKQVVLLEEKQQLVQNVRLRDNNGHQVDRPQLPDPPAVSELKHQRQEVTGRLQKLMELQAEQDLKKTHLLDELKKLRADEQRLLHPEPKTKTLPDPPSPEKDQHTRSASPKGIKGAKKGERPLVCGVPTRYQLSALLPQLRFLLPLCRQRWRIVQELLHSSEMTPPEHLPIVTVDRRYPLMERTDAERSVLMQVYKELRCEDLNYRWNKWNYDQWWEVKFIGEGIIDQGGGFRDSLVEMTDELCPPEFGTPEVLPFFVRTPNNKDGVGDFQDSYVPNPSCAQWPVYEWIGKILGAVYRSDENMTLTLPPFLWKLLVGEHVTWAKDFVDVDEVAVKFTDELECMDEDLYLATYGTECKFSTVLSDGARKDLVHGGDDVTVVPADRQRFAALLREARMTESVKQVLAIRRGLICVIPESVLGLLTWNELERGVCGNPDVSLAVLKSACKYGDDLSESTECIKHLWAALAQFTNDERSRFLRFVTGRRRPPAHFMIAKAGGSQNALPNASTCASTIFWPSYSSAAVATARLRYAVYNCIAIDTDTSPW